MLNNPHKIELPANQQICNNTFKIIRQNFIEQNFIDVVLGLTVCGIVLDFKNINGLDVGSVIATSNQIKTYNEIHPMHLRGFISLYRNTGLTPLMEN